MGAVNVGDVGVRREHTVHLGSEHAGPGVPLQLPDDILARRVARAARRLKVSSKEGNGREKTKRKMRKKQEKRTSRVDEQLFRPVT